MMEGHKLRLIIPALDEEASIGAVVRALPSWIDEIIVVDNGSRDQTAAVAREAGARVVYQLRRGYGAACLKGLSASGEFDLVVFMDGDGADDPDDIPKLLRPILDGRADFVLGSRNGEGVEAGALSWPQRLGNALACRFIAWIWGRSYQDLGPFRALRREALMALSMADQTFGWTVEMQIKALMIGCSIEEVPVSYRPRLAGRSKVSGSWRGAFYAGAKIMTVIAKLAWASGYRANHYRASAAR